MIITIDGPSGTGKSAVARLLAKKLHFSFFDTGALYRSLSWWICREGIEWNDIKKSLVRFDFSIQEEDGSKHYFVGKIEVTDEIRKKEITEVASKIAAIKEVRESLLPIQKNYAKKYDSVFEGRDLGTVVFPDAEVKIFLTASADIRAKRRYREILSKNPEEKVKLEEILESLEKRDSQDSSREIAPLKCPEGAFLLDTSELEVDQVVDILFQYILTKKNSCKAG